jgi:hypothetical protein
MKPIEVKINGLIRKSSQDICEEFLDTERWPEFTGYAILPGIKEAHFEIKTPELVGSRIRVHNTDGSSHVEEIIEWDTNSRIALLFREFSYPLASLASQFVETWEFQAVASGTEVTRKMTMVPKGVLGKLMLLPISRLMKKAFEKNFAQTATVDD